MFPSIHWNTPPITLEEGNGQATYLSNHPGPICQQKLQNFNDFFVRKLGFQPTSHRAGRYGFNQTIAGYLAHLGYLIDSRKDVRQFHNRLEQILSYLLDTRKLESITLTDVASLDLKSFPKKDIIS